MGFVFGRGKIACQSLGDRRRVDLSVEGQVKSYHPAEGRSESTSKGVQVEDR
jgi:hypothetical protein